MPEDLVLQHPHVHDWRYQSGEKRGRVYDGPIVAHAPPIYCECGEAAGSWAEVQVDISVEGDWTLSVGDIWPEGDHPVPVTAADVAAALERDGSRANAMNEWCLNFDVHVKVGSDHARAWSPAPKRNFTVGL